MSQQIGCPKELSERAEMLRHAVTNCRAIIGDAMMQPLSIHHKGKIDLVTNTDIAVEQCLINAIHAKFPMDDIWAEESGQQSTGAEYQWIIDPIDGTTNFSNRLPHFCISVALHHKGQALLGLIDDPSKDMQFFATRGRGATLNGQSLCVSKTEVLADALLATGFSYDRQTRPDNNVAEFDHMLRRCRGIRRMGAAALDLAYVAAGWLDGYWEYRLQPWDVAAGCLILEEAGGVVTRLDGEAYTVSDQNFCATNGRLHNELLDELKIAPTQIQPKSEQP